MAYRGLLRLGGVELANSARARTYIEGGLSPYSLSVTFDDTWALTARYLGQQEYRLPKQDRPPWWDAADADSEDFAGVWPLAVEGLDAPRLQREVMEGVGSGGTFGPPRYETRNIKVTALLVAKTTPGVDYGLRWLASTLRGDRCRGTWGGQTLEYLASVPDLPPDYATPALMECIGAYERTLYEVVCTRSPEVVERFGVDRGADGQHAAAYRVEFELTAGIPWAYRPAGLLVSDLAFNMATAATPIYFTIAVGGVCAANTCAEPGDTLTDPLAPTLSSIIRPIAPTTNAECEPLETRRTVATIPGSAISDFSDLVGNLTIRAGNQDERQLRVRWVRVADPAMSLDDLLACHTISEANVRYVPAGGSVTLDAVTGRPYARLGASTDRLDATPVVSGAEGGPWRPPVLACGQDDYMVVIDAPATVSPLVRFDIDGSVRE